MPAHVDDCAALANRLADAVYERLTAGATRVTIVHATPTASMTTDIVVRTLVPLDLRRFPVSRRPIPPSASARSSFSAIVSPWNSATRRRS